MLLLAAKIANQQVTAAGRDFCINSTKILAQ
jgi:hypothetical protein